VSVLTEIAKLTFSPMGEQDLQAFAGVENPKEALIAESDGAVYILDGNTISVVTEDGRETQYRVSLIWEMEHMTHG
jgi:hypothetical protein